MHVACALWNPDIDFAHPEQMSGVRLDRLTKERMGLTCGRCGQGGGGAVQCAYPSCYRAFHVLCGVMGGQVATFRCDGEPLPFCTQHSGSRYEAAREAMVEGREPQQAQQGDEEEEGGAAAACDVDPSKLSAYELERRMNVERNERMLKAIRNGGKLPTAVEGGS